MLLAVCKLGLPNRKAICLRTRQKCFEVSATEAFSFLLYLRAFAACFLELNVVYWQLRSTNVLFKILKYFYDESEFIVAFRGQSLVS